MTDLLQQLHSFADNLDRQAAVLRGDAEVGIAEGFRNDSVAAVMTKIAADLRREVGAKPAVQPSPEHSHEPLHWVQRRHEPPTVWTWMPETQAWGWFDPTATDKHNGYFGDTWSRPPGKTGAEDAYSEGYRYLGVARWPKV
jgi:hypothetical protein